ncbi:MAG: phage protease, partial [Kiritimatiellae bacterium]|nr:phage protease [Kiritimatiellia bacterium]
ILGDREHWSLTADKATDALAWFRDFELRADGLYGKPRKTTLGKELIDGGTLRGVSPVLEVEAESGDEIADGSRVVPIAIDSIGFTNRPRLKQFMRPVSNKADGARTKNNNQPEENMKLVNKALGIGENAEEASAVSEIERLKEEIRQKESRIAELEKAETDKAADTFVSENKEKIADTDEARQSLRKLYLENKDSATELVKHLAPAPKSPAPKVPNKSTKQPESATDTSGDSGKAARIKNRAQSLTDSAKSRGEKLDWPDAWAQAKSEVENG